MTTTVTTKRIKKKKKQPSGEEVLWIVNESDFEPASKGSTGSGDKSRNKANTSGGGVPPEATDVVPPWNFDFTWDDVTPPPAATNGRTSPRQSSQAQQSGTSTPGAGGPYFHKSNKATELPAGVSLHNVNEWLLNSSSPKDFLSKTKQHSVAQFSTPNQQPPHTPSSHSSSHSLSHSQHPGMGGYNGSRSNTPTSRRHNSPFTQRPTNQAGTPSRPTGWSGGRSGTPPRHQSPIGGGPPQTRKTTETESYRLVTRWPPNQMAGV
eukprot:TRINITY_DN34445_c0_g1_i1.p1 TRINITY_DN34445_c0_g1~~TRINITY_DN34445_c0_g1_i1.p1  ORF type:complete len:301 (+),score=30.86 TRINITY_DN34445_c0_g1_i1:112-903(+)